MCSPHAAFVSEQHIARIRKVAFADAALAADFRVLFEPYAAHAQDGDELEYLAMMCAIAWNAGALETGDMTRFLSDVDVHARSSPGVLAMMAAMAAEKKLRFPGDKRCIALCHVDGEPGSYTLQAWQWPNEMEVWKPMEPSS